MKRLLTFCVVSFCFAHIFAQVTIKQGSVSEKTYPDNTRTGYFELNEILSRTDKKFLVEMSAKNENFLRLYFFKNNEQMVMFESVINFTAEDVVNFFNEVFKFANKKEEEETDNENVLRAPAADPCTDITHIAGCGASYKQTITLSGTGSWTSNPCNSYALGNEKIYSFTPTETGYYELIVTDATLLLTVDYLWKSGSCSSSGWTCISAVSSSGTYAIGNLTAGTTYYFLLDSEGSMISRTHSFYISCAVPPAANPCANIIPIADCGVEHAKTVTLSGSGSWGTNPCYSSPGKEQIYSFIPTETGYYSIVVTSASGGYVDYLWKSGSCSSSGWTCIDDLSSTGTYTIAKLTAGTTYYILLDAEGTSSRTHSFYIKCAVSISGCNEDLLQTNGCSDASPFCTSDDYCFVASTNVESMGDIGCCNTTPNPAWYWMKVDQAGNLVIDIVQKRIDNNEEVDVDFIAWGPFNSKEEACVQKSMTTSGENNHNHNGVYPMGNIVDCCYCISATESLQINNAQPGQIYLLLLTNYKNVPAYISFKKGGGSATTTCDIINNNTITLCEGDTLRLEASTAAGITYQYWKKEDDNSYTDYGSEQIIPNVTADYAGLYLREKINDITGNAEGGIDSVFVIINFPSETVIEISGAELPYTENGFNVTEQGTYYQYLINSQGCDSIVKLIVISTYDIIIKKEICEGESYLFNGVEYNTTIIHTDTLTSVFGSDSIVTLDLTVHPLQQITIDTTICSTKNYDFYGTILTNTGTFYHTITAVGDGCDTVVTLNLVVEECSKIEIMPLAEEICADDDFISLFFNALKGNLVCYSVTFNDKAIAAGFENIVCKNPVFTDKIEIPVPQFPSPFYVRPDHYKMNVDFKFADDSIHSFGGIIFSVLYPNRIMEQKWNDVIALLNKNFNGGYEFSVYEWYKDGKKLENENRSYIYVGENNYFDFTSNPEYRARLTRTDDNEAVYTCAFIPKDRTEYFYNDIPTVINNGSNIHVKSDENGMITFISVSGIIVGKQHLNVGENYIQPPKQQGFYIMVIEKDNQTPIKQVLIVK